MKYNTWSDDTKDKITKEGADRYNEHLCSMFRAYLSCDDEEFVDTINDESRKWTQGKFCPAYYYCCLMDRVRLTYINLVESYSWSINCVKPKKAEKNYFVRPTELLSKFVRNRGPTSGSVEQWNSA